MKIVQTTLLIVLAALLTACAGAAGHKFDLPSGDLMKVGITTEKQVIASMGKPNETGDFELNGVRTKVFVYGPYVYVDKPGAVTYGRIVNLKFTDGLLVSYQLMSNFPGESTDFDLSKVTSFTEGVSTRKDVEMTLGKASGEAIHPLVKDPDRMYIFYDSWSHDEGSNKVAFELDKNDVVQNIRVKTKPKKK